MADEKEKQAKIRYRRWCMTIWQSERFPDKESLAKELCKTKVKFLIIGAEFTKSDKPHFQTYVEFENGRSFDSLHKQFPNDGYFKQARGTAQDSIDYCSKTDDCPFKLGYPNVAQATLSKADISSNLVDLMMSFEYNKMPPLYEFIRDYPDLGDYIIRNYNVLEKIYNEIYKDKVNYHCKPQQQVIELQDENLPF